MNRKYSEPHPVEIDEDLWVIENYYGVQIFNEHFPTWEEAQSFIDTFNWRRLEESEEI